MCGVSMKDRRTSEKLRKLVGVQPITTVIGIGRLRWYGHVMRKSNEDWVKKCMEITELKTEEWLEDMFREYGSGYGRTRDRQRRNPWQEEMMTECYVASVSLFSLNIVFDIIT